MLWVDHLCASELGHVKDQRNIHVHLEKRMFWKVLHFVFVPSDGLDENNIAFIPVVLYLFCSEW